MSKKEEKRQARRTAIITALRQFLDEATAAQGVSQQSDAAIRAVVNLEEIFGEQRGWMVTATHGEVTLMAVGPFADREAADGLLTHLACTGNYKRVVVSPEVFEDEEEEVK